MTYLDLFLVIHPTTLALYLLSKPIVYKKVSWNE